VLLGSEIVSFEVWESGPKGESTWDRYDVITTHDINGHRS